MHDFPPRIDAYTRAETARPDTRSPARFLLWTLRVQFDVLIALSIAGLAWFLPSALSPYLLGRTIDAGILVGDWAATLLWAGLLALVILVGAASGIVMHTFAVRGWLISLYGTQKLVTRKSVQLGHVLNRRLPTGEVLSISSSDSDIFGATFEVVARAIGALGAFAVVAALMLNTSGPLGLVVLLVAPLLVAAATPVLRPLNRAQTAERTQNGELTSQAADIVAGLRILRGIGGEKTFGDNYAAQSQRVRRLGVTAGTWQAVVETLSVLLSGLLLVILVWLGTHEMMAGRLTLGQLISFVGYAIFMVWPLQTMFEVAQKWVRGLVSARKTVALLSAELPWLDGSREVSPRPRLLDERSGVTVEPGEFLVVVSADPDESAALADRLGRYLPAGAGLGNDESDEELKGRAARLARAEKERRRAEVARQDAETAAAPWGVSADGLDYQHYRIGSLRERVLVSDAGSQLFAGTFQQAVDPLGGHSREQAEQALWSAAADEVFESLPDGWASRVDEKGRGLSGGQRQRVVLARALLADPEVLVLVEPTSAVDAHTEEAIAVRLAEHRRGRTTVVMTGSPLLVHRADRVAFLADGRQVATGTHDQLIREDADYRAVINRGMEGEDDH
ncbi:ABC transporter transmembrane domain-containing protein [Micropruina sp.]|uniref:ABC transporter transmembrane domain-containing protein n=1 Tax=Micropruina sp. TaxID=2737536 RepID=UPI0039E37AB5